MTERSAFDSADADLRRRLQAALGADYHVDRTLGSGGFAVVFLVRDVRLKRELAVKVLSPELATSKTAERFSREAETIAGLSHPNIVPLHFIGQTDELLYLVMGYVDGGSLADRIRAAGPLSVDDSVRVLVEVSSALAHAHKRGVVHRDIKPHNILLDAESGRALVTDFGIARSVESTSITTSGIVLGTPAYLAPEQVTGEPVDHRADIFALGVVAYEMLTGHHPYQAPSAAGVLMKRLAGPPPPLAGERRDVSPALQQVIDGCLAVDPAERFASAADVGRALTGHTPTSGARRMMATVAVRRRRQPVIIGLAAVTVVVAGAAAGWWPRDRRAGVTPALPLAVDSSMALIPTGAYTVGADVGPPNARHRPAHRVSLVAFGIDKLEVTVGEYAAYATSRGAATPWQGEAPPTRTLPVAGVSLTNASSYCRWKHPDGGRLPTEEEWEAAARGEPVRAFPWGDGPATGMANTATGHRASAALVGSFPTSATPEGVQDLIGNVWELTDSPMRAYQGGASLPDSLARYRVIRGGAFNVPDTLATSWYRGYVPPEAPPRELQFTGFRCAMSTRPRASLPAAR